MGYGILRVRNLHAGDLAATDRHNRRLYDSPEQYPENIDPSGWWGVSEEHDKPLVAAIEARTETFGIKPRSNSVLALEFVISASKDVYEKVDPHTYLMEAEIFLAKRFGGENIVSSILHFDESTPHAHIIIVPIQQKAVKWKNRNGQGTRLEHRLCARDVTGGPAKLRELQEDFYGFLSESSALKEATFHRGTLVEQQKREYVRHTSAELGRIRNELHQLGIEAIKAAELLKTQAMSPEDYSEKTKEIQQRKDELTRSAETIEENMRKELPELEKRVEIRKKRNKGEGWKKGIDPFKKGKGGIGI
jgi:hypothetical protein